MGRESTAWVGLKAKLERVGLRTRRITHRFEPGWPDVLWVEKGLRLSGYVELKAVERWPVRGGPLRMDIRREQTNWIRKWVADGGLGGVLCRVTQARQWVYWPGKSDIDWPRLMLEDPGQLEQQVFPDPLNVQELVSLITDLEVHI